MKWLKFAGVTLLAVLTASCTKGPKADTPEGALQKYIVTAFNVDGVGDREKLKELSTGEALDFLNQMDDEAFKKHFIDSKLQFVSMNAKDLRREVSGDVSLVYELSFRERTGPTVHTNKKIAYLTYNSEEGIWKIKATKNLKSFVEVKEDLVITPETTAGSSPEKENSQEPEKN